MQELLARNRRRSWEIVQEAYRDVPSRDKVFFQEVERHLGPDAVVLDAGCGYDAAALVKLQGRARQLVGVSLEREFRVSPPVQVARGDLERIPLRAETVDLVVSRMVAEHLDRPMEVLSEVRRVLRPGGHAIFFTPSRWHYASLAADALPYRTHRFFVTLAFGEKAYANFPTRYRMNSVRALRGLAAATGLRLVRLIAVRHYPSYLLFSPTLLRAGMVYERLVARLKLRSLHPYLVATFQKEARP